MQPDSQVWDGVQDFAVLTSSHGKLLLLLRHRPHFENQEPEKRDEVFWCKLNQRYIK